MFDLPIELIIIIYEHVVVSGRCLLPILRRLKPLLLINKASSQIVLSNVFLGIIVKKFNILPDACVSNEYKLRSTVIQWAVVVYRKGATCSPKRCKCDNVGYSGHGIMELRSLTSVEIRWTIGGSLLLPPRTLEVCMTCHDNSSIFLENNSNIIDVGECKYLVVGSRSNPATIP